MFYDPKRTELLKLLNGIRKGRISLSAIYQNWPVKTYHLHTEVPGFVLDGAMQPVDPTAFVEIVRTWPKLKLMLLEIDKHKVYQTIKNRLDKGTHEFLRELLPDAEEREWQKARKEKQEREEKEAEKALHEQERIAELWATLHPLNQEWGIPPPPNLGEDTEEDFNGTREVSFHEPDQPVFGPTLDHWIVRYRPYMYGRDGYLFRKKTKERKGLCYERSDKDGAFPSDKRKEEPAVFAKTTVRAEAVPPIIIKAEPPANHPLPPEPPPPQASKYTVSASTPVNQDRAIRKIADAMRGVGVRR
jgi:hypothetical protein